MGKGRGRAKSEITKLRSEIRRYKSEIRTLTERLDSIKKFNSDAPKPSKPEHTNEADCPHCGKGVLKKIDLKYIILKSCNICDYQERKNVKKKDF